MIDVYHKFKKKQIRYNDYCRQGKMNKRTTKEYAYMENVCIWTMYAYEQCMHMGNVCIGKCVRLCVCVCTRMIRFLHTCVYLYVCGIVHFLLLYI